MARSISARSLDTWLKRLVSAYGNRILPIDRDVARTGVAVVNPWDAA